MKALACEMCGSQDVVKQDGLFICQHCSTKYSVEEAKRMIIEGTVKVDTSEELNNLYKLARRAKEENNSENAAKYYEMILTKDPSSWEANFFSVYFTAMTCKIGEIASAAASVSSCVQSTFVLIRDNVVDSGMRKQAIIEVQERAFSISDMLYKAANRHRDSMDPSVRARFDMELSYSIVNSAEIKESVCDQLCSLFMDDKELMSTVGVSILKEHISRLRFLLEKEKEYVRTIQKFEPSYQPPQKQSTGDTAANKSSGGSGGCYVATAVYGSYDCPQVWTLRRFRDYTLAETWYGRVFIYAYYTISPILVKWFGQTKWFKNLWKPALDHMVENLNENGVENTPYNDRVW